MAELPEFPPVVLVAVELPVLLVVPVGEGLLAFRTPGREDEERDAPGCSNPDVSWTPCFSTCLGLETL